jgi:hypothetical protein
MTGSEKLLAVTTLANDPDKLKKIDLINRVQGHSGKNRKPFNRPG